jgi:hypothetical protein
MDWFGTARRWPRISVEQILESLRFGRLDEVVVEADLHGASAVAVLRIARQGYQEGCRRRGRGAQPPGDFVAVHAVGQAEVQDDDIRSVVQGRVEGGGAVGSDEGMVAPKVEQEGQGFYLVLAVVHDQHTQRSSGVHFRPR